MTRAARKRPWIVFSISVALILGALLWVTAKVLELHDHAGRARIDAHRNSLVQRATWRMDAALAPVLAAENARPPFHYRAFAAPGGAGGAGALAGAPLDPDLPAPSPLLASSSPIFRLHFQLGSDGALASPQVPLGEERGLAERELGVPAAQLDRAAARLEELGGLLDGATVAALFSRTMGRAQAADGRLGVDPGAIPTANPQGYGSFRPVLIEGSRAGETELLLVRSVDVGEARALQGIWTDRAALARLLLAEVDDLVPGARLLTDTGDVPGEPLATLPLSLVAGAPAGLRVPGWGPLHLALLLTWIAVLAAVLTAGLALRAAVELGERRGRFVSAVTHELRTPLTTFCMYAEMLADGMVQDEGDRQEYLDTLKRESSRLRGIVDNVLLYAQLERGRAADVAAATRRVPARGLLEAALPDLALRASEAGMELVPALEVGAAEELDVDPQGVERVLTNLVDNACKYARGASDRRIHLEARTAEGALEVRVRDHGPGVPPAAARAIFDPFRRGPGGGAGPARRAAARGSADPTLLASGIGLGLALSRGTAERLGGSLELLAPGTEPGDAGGGGATFCLRLPLAPPRSAP